MLANYVPFDGLGDVLDSTARQETRECPLQGNHRSHEGALRT